MADAVDCSCLMLALAYSFVVGIVDFDEICLFAAADDVAVFYCFYLCLYCRTMRRRVAETRQMMKPSRIFVVVAAAAAAVWLDYCYIYFDYSYYYYYYYYYVCCCC